MPSTLIRAGLRPLAQIAAVVRGAGSSLRDFAASKASQGAGSSACAVGLRRRVGAVAKFSSTDRAALRRARGPMAPGQLGVSPGIIA